MLLILPVAGIVFGVTFIADRAWKVKAPIKPDVFPVYDAILAERELRLLERPSRFQRFIHHVLFVKFFATILIVGGLPVLMAIVRKADVIAGIWLLVFIVAFVYSSGWMIRGFVRIFVVHPRFVLSRSVLPLGSTSILRWQTNSGFGRLDSLSLELVGEEVAWYSAGTDRVEAASVFHLEPLLETTDREFIQSGSVELRIPADSMHTLTASANQIRWMLRVRGNFPWLPKLKEEFEIQVSPGVSRAKEASNSRT
ncbi:hypothetical protein [Lacunimicrobium album]